MSIIVEFERDEDKKYAIDVPKIPAPMMAIL
jgi:hypothetical protein